MLSGKTIAVVVPAYNEEKLIVSTVESIPQYVDKVFVVNDGSSDSTADVVAAYLNERVKLISHHKNQGVGAAIATGYRKALEDKMDIAVVMAGDFQMDPKYIVDLVSPIIKGTADYAKGDRLTKAGYQKGMSPWRRLGNWLLNWLTRIATGNWKLSDPQHGYTAISQKALIKIGIDNIYPGYGYCNDILIKMAAYGLKTVDIPIPARYGYEKSKIRYGSYIPKVSWLLFKGFLWRLKAIILGRNRLK